MVLIDIGTNDFHKELLSILGMYNMYKAPHSCCRYTQHISIFRVASSIFCSLPPSQESVSMPTYNNTCSCKKSIWNPLKTRRYHRWTRNTCWPWRAFAQFVRREQQEKRYSLCQSSKYQQCAEESIIRQQQHRRGCKLSSHLFTILCCNTRALLRMIYSNLECSISPGHFEQPRNSLS